MVGDLFQFLKISLPKGGSCEGGDYFIVSNGNPYWVIFSLKSSSWAEKIILWKKAVDNKKMVAIKAYVFWVVKKLNSLLLCASIIIFTS